MESSMFQVVMLNFHRVMRKKSSWLSPSWIWRIEGTKTKVTRGRGQISVMGAREADDRASLEWILIMDIHDTCVIFVIFSDFQLPRIGSQYFFQRSKVITLHHAERGWRICWPLHPQVSHYQPLHHWRKVIKMQNISTFEKLIYLDCWWKGTYIIIEIWNIRWP